MQVSCALFKLYRQNREGLDIENKAVASILRHEPTLSLTSVKILSKNVEFDSLGSHKKWSCLRDRPSISQRRHLRSESSPHQDRPYAPHGAWAL